MTLSGLAMAIGPLVDSAIISLENTDRHLERGTPLIRAALDGPSEVALPELVASLSTLMVLSPLALMPGSGSFLFRPMTLAVAFAMGTAYILSRTFVPARAAGWLKENNKEDEDESKRKKKKKSKGNAVTRAFAKWQDMIVLGIAWYTRRLDWVLGHRWIVLIGAYLALGLTLLLLFPIRREFFPQVDSGSFEMFVRAPSGTKLEATNDKIAEVEKFIRQQIPADDLKIIVSEIGVTPDISAAYTQNQAKMDAIVRVQLSESRQKGSYEYADVLRKAVAKDRRFTDLEFAFNAGGLIRGALNQGQSTPINVRVTGKKLQESHEIADRIRRKVAEIDGVVDARILQRLDYPEYIITVDRTKAADLGLTQKEVMENVISAFNSSIQFNKDIFWIDRDNGNQYFVGVQYPLESIDSLESLLNVPLTGVNQSKSGRRVKQKEIPSLSWSDETPADEAAPPVLLSSLVSLSRSSIPTEVTHLNIRPAIDLNIGVHGRDLGHVADDVHDVISQFGTLKKDQSSSGGEAGTTWNAYDPTTGGHQPLKGTEIVLSGEYARMNQTFRDLGVGLILAIILIYFLMVGLVKSYLVPLSIMLVVPLVLVGVLPMLFLTGTSINVQSLLGIIFIVGIQVSNTVLLTDVAQNLRKQEGLLPMAAIRQAGELRVRPVIMTALAAFFAMIPTALALEKGSEANAPLGRAILGGLIIGTPCTLLVVPALYSLLVHGPIAEPEDPEEVPEGGKENEEGDDDEDENEDDDS